MNDLHLYARYAGVSIRSQLQYRASFVMQAIGQAVITSIEFIGIWALFHRFGGLRDWSLPDVALFYGLISVTFAIADALARGFDQFALMVKGGDFDRLLVRPRSTVLQLIGQELTLRRVGRLAQGTVVLTWAAATADVSWTISAITVLAFAIVGGVCLFIGLVVLQATSAFWTTESLEVWNAFTYGGVSMSQYPMSIYRPWFRRVFTYVIPLACVNYLPVAAILGRADAPDVPLALQMSAPLAGVIFLVAALQIWQIGVRHYRSTGS